MPSTASSPTPTQLPPDDTAAPEHRSWSSHDPPRHTMPAGHVLLVGAVCLLVGAMLNASSIRKTALGQPVGWKRNVATFFAEPLYDFSHFLHTDRLRSGLQGVIGRSGADDVDVTLPSPTTTTTTTTPTDTTGSAPTTTTTLPPKASFSPTNPLHIWVGGDSLSITPGESVINVASATQAVAITNAAVDGRVSTGLARPEVFNWPAYLTDVQNAHQPKAYVLTLGSNDDQTLTGENGVGPFGSPEWEAEYRRRVGGLMDTLTADHKHQLFLVGIPIVRNTDRAETRYRVINEIYKTEAAKRPGLVHYIDIYDMFKGPDGGYTDSVISPDDGSVVQIRAADGIHFTRAGGDRIAAKVVEAIANNYDLTSWQQMPTTTTTPPDTP